MPEVATEGIKVSIVVATYRSGKGLDRLVSSLDSQSMPTTEWEAIFVDDGSPDDTYDRLQQLAADRPHFRFARIENSGWPCRPRNTGIDLARGEYVGFMDHDDELYPDALRDGYAFAHANRADVLNGKEARTDNAGWASEQFTEDIPQVLGRGLPFGALTPTNPHKLYRRAFLDEHGIRFREGGRVLWEDIFFNVQALAHADVISTMSSTPYYHWFTTRGSGSTTFRRAKPEWWNWLAEVLRAIEGDLAAPELARERDLLLEHQYRARLIEAFNNYYAQRTPDVRKLIYDHARSLQSEFFDDERFDEFLDVTWRLRAKLLRDGHPHALDRLVAVDQVIPARPRATGARWVDGELEVDVAVQWQDSAGKQPALRRDGSGRILKDLPSQFLEIFSPEQLDVTEEIRSAAVQIGVRSQRSRIGWLAPTHSESWLGSGDDVAFGVRGSGRIDPRNAALGKPLDPEIWDVTAQVSMAHSRWHPALRGHITPIVRLDEDGFAAAYTNEGGGVVLDLSPGESLLPQLVVPRGDVERSGDGLQIEVLITEVLADGERRVTIPVLMTDEPRRSPFSGFSRRRSPSATEWEKVTGMLTVADGVAKLHIPVHGATAILLGARHHEGLFAGYRIVKDRLTAR